MANDIGNITSVSGSSMALNSQKGGAAKPSASGQSNPNGTKPAKEGTAKTMLPSPK